MYQFSRSLYRQLADEVVPSRGENVALTRQHFLRTCEVSMELLALDRHYFAKPVKTLFNDVRHFFPWASSSACTGCAGSTWRWPRSVDSRLRTGTTFDGSPARCHARTRRGSPFRRVPSPGRKYCPSHKHLDDVATVAAA